MITIDLNNIEELIFYNSSLQSKLPEFQNLFNIWKFSITNNLKPLGKKVILDFINSLKDEHIKIIGEYFNDEISIGILDYHIVKNIKICEEGCVAGFVNAVVYRDKDEINLTFWR